MTQSCTYYASPDFTHDFSVPSQHTGFMRMFHKKGGYPISSALQLNQEQGLGGGGGAILSEVTPYG